MNLIYTIAKPAEEMFSEPSFSLFKHEGLWCCIQRLMWTGNLNGYVGVGEWHPWYGYDYGNEEVIAEVHGGITYARGELLGIEDAVLGKLWWFGFDTIHAMDLKAFQNDIDRNFQRPDGYDVYRNFAYVKEETIHLAEQLLAAM